MKVISFFSLSTLIKPIVGSLQFMVKRVNSKSFQSSCTCAFDWEYLEVYLRDNYNFADDSIFIFIYLMLSIIWNIIVLTDFNLKKNDDNIQILQPHFIYITISQYYGIFLFDFNNNWLYSHLQNPVFCRNTFVMLLILISFLILI